MTTFYSATDRTIASNFLNHADSLYKSVRPDAAGWERMAVDCSYFAATRLF